MRKTSKRSNRKSRSNRDKNRKTRSIIELSSQGRGSSRRKNKKSNAALFESNLRQSEAREVEETISIRTRATVFVFCLTLFAWAYWPNLLSLVHSWSTVPDYSHGFLVLPIAAFFLYSQRDKFPSATPSLSIAGLGLLLLGLLIRYVGGLFYMESIEGFSIPFWLGGLIWFLFGAKVFRWSLPAVVFLFFLLPLPYSLEHAMSVPLQTCATKLSSFVLQCLLVPAIDEGNTILLNEHRLDIERACSGLRIFAGVFAIAYLFAIFYSRRFAVQLSAFAGALPIAVLANTVRIVLTAFLLQFGLGAQASTFVHDLAGWLMIPIAVGMFLVFVSFVEKLLPSSEVVDSREIIQNIKK